MERIPLQRCLSESVRRKICLTVAFGAIVVIFIVLTAFLMSKSIRDLSVPSHLESSSCPKDYKNHPLILVSLDGFRASYLKLGITPSLKKLADKGVSTPFMIPSFPSNTFPNHYTIVTGLYPESHGIVNNRFYDSTFDDTFAISRSVQYEGRWWGGEPIWNTIKKQGMKSATYFWVGSETPINGLHPDFFKKYNNSVPFEERINEVMNWITLPVEERPRFIAVYFNQPDSSGHKYGPKSSEVKKQITRVDDIVKLLVNKIKREKLLHCVNLLIVSDHGMATTTEEDRVPLENFFQNVSEILESPLKDFQQFSIKEKYSDWQKRVESAFSCAPGIFRLYRKEDLPKRLHYSNNKGIGDYVFLHQSGIQATVHSDWSSAGAHGYDNQYSTMRGIFIGYGPDLKNGISTESFQNIELYNLMCHLLGVTPAPNNGTSGALNRLLKHPPPLVPLPQDSEPRLVLQMPVNVDSYLDSKRSNTSCSDSQFTFSDLASLVNKLNTTNIERVFVPWGSPLAPSGHPFEPSLLLHPDHITGFSQALKLPLWSAFSINAKPKVEILKSFNWSLDVRIPVEFSPPCRISQEKSFKNRSFSLVPLFYTGLSPNESWATLSSLNSNGIPISSYLKPKWETLIQKYLGLWFEYHGPLHLAVGPIFDQDADGLMDERPYLSVEGITIPSHIFAIVVKCRDIVTDMHHCYEDHLDVLSFIFPQHQQIESCFEEKEFMRTFLAPIKDIEKLTQLFFFPKISPTLRNRLSLRIQSEIWQ